LEARVIEMTKYLASNAFIDWHHPPIRNQAARLADGCGSRIEIAKRCFEWVRDNVKHSYDHQLNPVTCKASDVLLHGTGFCFAKSHLLAALLRANGIAAGLCYQRLRADEDGGSTYILHGLNAAYLPEWGWYRMDARGNKPGIDAQFCPPLEKLAFRADRKLEATFPEIWAEPSDVVVDVLTKYKTFAEVWQNLPDRV
jgi:transglutaminase-like putative cysteine protease